MTRSVARSILALVFTLACAHEEPQSQPAADPRDQARDDAALAAARAFQADYERELREDPRSFLTTIAAHYLGPGQRLALRLDGGEWLEAEASTEPSLGFEVRGEILAVIVDGRETLIDTATTLPVDERFSLGLSAQGQDWRVLIHDRDAPLRASFPGVAWFPATAALIVTASFEPNPTRPPKLLQTSRGTTKTLYLAGQLRFYLADTELELMAFAYAPEPEPAEPWLVPFRDATSGEQSYAAGRYLELSAPTDAGAVVLDFNRATNPLCAYSEHYNCPVPPSFNHLELPIEAGAMVPASSAHEGR